MTAITNFAPTAAGRGGVARDPLTLSLRRLTLTFVRQSPAFWLINLYVMFEYVRPQSVYPSLDVLPWAKISLFSAAALVVIEGRPRLASRAVWLSLGLFTMIIVASSITAVFPSVSWDRFSLWVNWLLLIFVIGAGIKTRQELLLLCLAWTLWNVKMSQHGARKWVFSGFSFDAWGVSGAPGWFQNSGEFGIEMCVFLPFIGYLTYGAWPLLSRNRRIIALAIIWSVLASVIATSSRGAFFGVAVTAAWIAIRSRYRFRIGMAAIGAVTVLWLLLPEGNKARWRNAGNDPDSQARLTYWKHGIKIANAYPVLGIGYENWIYYYRAHYNPKGEVPHNYLVEAASQMGYTGLVGFLVMTGLFFRSNARVRRRTAERSSNPDRILWAMAYGLDGAMIGFLVSGFFVTVLFYPYYWMNLALALALARVSRWPATRRTVQAGAVARFPGPRTQRLTPQGSV